MFDVGAGDSFYIEMPNGDDILIDGGLASYGQKIVNKLLKKEKNMSLEYVISTHPDADHAGGLQTVFKKLKVKNFYYPKDTSYSKTKTAKNLMALAKKESGCKVLNAKPGTKISCGDGSYFKFIQSKTDYKSDNEDSVMTYIKYKDLDVLLAGDAEKGAEYNGVAKIDMDIVTAPHHGSKNSSSSSYIKKFDPEAVWVSTDGHKYGHPTQAAFDRYKKYDKKIKVYRTDKKGDVTMTSNGKTKSYNCTGTLITKTKGNVSSSSSKTSTSTKTSSKYVYVSKSNTYHAKSNCSGMKTSTRMTLAEAKSKGAKPCSKCY